MTISEMSTIPEVDRKIPRKPFRICLDVGCGYGRYGFILKTDLDRPIDLLVGFDAYPPALNFCRRHNIYDVLVTGIGTALPFADNSVDLILAIDIVEHLPDVDAALFLSELERVSSDITLVTTPGYFFSNEEQVEGLGNEWDKHKSLWTSKKLRKHGYNVEGWWGKELHQLFHYGKHGRIPKPVLYLLMLFPFFFYKVFFFVPRYFPSRAARLIAYRGKKTPLYRGLVDRLIQGFKSLCYY